jgi:beta-N-acetylhexosaminidase
VIHCYGISFQELTLEEKVGQLLMVHFNGEVANSDAEFLIQQLHVGGMIYYNWANGLHSPEQVSYLSSSLQALAQQNRLPIPLLIAIDQEGGLVARLQEGFTIFPGNKAVGMTQNLVLAEQSAYAIGEELRAVGINMNLAPVVDINTQPRNPVIGIRSFGESAAIVIPFAKAALRGYHQAGMITTLKHFPGHGDVEVDSHEDLPILKKTQEQLKKEEWLPFAALAQEADSIMTAHIMVPALDTIHCATLSKKILQLLHDEIGFNGVVIADSLVMEGIVKNVSSIDEAAIGALEAGCDLLMLGGKQLIGHHAELTVADVRRIHRSIVTAVQEGRLSEERLNQAVQRILDLKQRYQLGFYCVKPFIPIKEHQTLADTIARNALQVVDRQPLFLKQSKIALFAPINMQETIQHSALLTLGKELQSFFFKDLNPIIDEQKMIITTAKEADVIIFCSYNAWRYKEQATVIEELLKQAKPFVLICLRDPLDATLFPKVHRTMITFSPTLPALKAVYERLLD